VNARRQRNSSLGGSCSSVVGGYSWGLSGITGKKNPHLPRWIGDYSLPQGRNFYNNKMSPFYEGSCSIVEGFNILSQHCKLNEICLNNGRLITAPTSLQYFIISTFYHFITNKKRRRDPVGLRGAPTTSLYCFIILSF